MGITCLGTASNKQLNRWHIRTEKEKWSWQRESGVVGIISLAMQKPLLTIIELILICGY